MFMVDSNNTAVGSMSSSKGIIYIAGPQLRELISEGFYFLWICFYFFPITSFEWPLLLRMESDIFAQKDLILSFFNLIDDTLSNAVI